ncbi:hypothetical protein FF38_12231 [Lucilia cuprina]|uniref:Uncharacterized protein n=1 Tax=Lucilia cuprina TaxID=7375 RepID=A0A0L0C1I9_LUCCU|nr:hypothetical protein FF38_12231 [Lucilia cuprina]
MDDQSENSLDRQIDDNDGNKPEKMFTLKKWNAVAMWSWDVECDICAICRVQVMGKLFVSLNIINDVNKVHTYLFSI